MSYFESYQQTVFFNPDTLCIPGVTETYDVYTTNYLSTRNYTLLVTVQDIDTSVVVRLEGSMDGATFGAMIEVKDIEADRYVGALRGDATKLPFADNTFDRVITSEVLEHIQDDVSAIAELARVVRPGGTLACTVPSWWPEKINWMLSDEYHAPKSVGGHGRI